jgi:hypothetical protein
MVDRAGRNESVVQKQQQASIHHSLIVTLDDCIAAMFLLPLGYFSYLVQRMPQIDEQLSRHILLLNFARTSFAGFGSVFASTSCFAC